MTDQELLTRFQSGDTAALCELIRRHTPLVHATALRECRDPHVAEDITQAAFLVLARRAKTLPSNAVLPGWLFRTTLFAAADARKLQNRRIHHEREAAAMRPTIDPPTPAQTDEIHAFLNQAIAALSPADRDAVVLRYLQSLPPSAVAAALGTTEGTARQRVARAVERLRKHFAKRGLLIALAALASLLEALPAHAVAADLAARLTDVAKGKIVPTSTSQTLAQGVTHMIRIQRLTRNALFASAVAAGGVLVLVLPLTLSRVSANPPRLQAAIPPSPAPVVATTLEAPKASGDVIKAAVDAHTAFAVDLYRELNKTSANQNLFLSPFSISTITGLTAAGARGNTLTQMNKVLHLSDPEAVHAGVSQIAHQLTDSNGGTKAYQLSIANGLWEDETNPFKPEFLALAQKYYNLSGLTTLSFKANPDAARTLINKWVEDKTQTKIKDLLPPDSITEKTGLVLTNAIYFKGEWVTPFEPVRTGRNRPAQPFYVSSTKSVQPTFMQVRSGFPYFENDDLQAISLPYKTTQGAGRGGGFAGSGNGVPDISMVIILPKTRDGLAALEKKISPASLDQWTSGLADTEIAVTLPKFEITCPTKLTDTFKQMGMPDAFNVDQANLDGISTPPPGYKVYISDVFHKAFIKVDEKGTEAAAATAVVGGLGSGMPRPVPIFLADHPFFFFIRYEPTHSILFMGHLVDPGGGGAAPSPRAESRSGSGAGSGSIGDLLATASQQLASAKLALQSATTNNHGGYVEKARDHVVQANVDMDAAIAYADAHPEISTLSAAASPEAAAAADNTKGLSFDQPNNQRSMVTALKALQATLAALQQAGGGNIGGSRDKLILDIDRAATDVSDGFDFLRTGGKTTPAGNNSPKSGSSLP